MNASRATGSQPPGNWPPPGLVLAVSSVVIDRCLLWPLGRCRNWATPQGYLLKRQEPHVNETSRHSTSKHGRPAGSRRSHHDRS
jgi:hypothetical protein